MRGNNRPEQQECLGWSQRARVTNRVVIWDELLFCVVKHQDTAGVLANLRICSDCIQMVMKFLFYDGRCLWIIVIKLIRVTVQI